MLNSSIAVNLCASSCALSFAAGKASAATTPKTPAMKHLFLIFTSCQRGPKHVSRGQSNIDHTYVQPPCRPDRPEANPHAFNQYSACYLFRCCHQNNISFATIPT